MKQMLLSTTIGEINSCEKTDNHVKITIKKNDDFVEQNFDCFIEIAKAIESIITDDSIVDGVTITATLTDKTILQGYIEGLRWAELFQQSKNFDFSKGKTKVDKAFVLHNGCDMDVTQLLKINLMSKVALNNYSHLIPEYVYPLIKDSMCK